MKHSASRPTLLLLLALSVSAFVSGPALAQKSWTGERGAATRTGWVNLAEHARQEALNPQAAAPVEPDAIHSPLRLPDDLPVAEGANAPAPAAQAGGSLAVSSPAASSSFQGMADNLTGTPPDTHGAAGPDHLVVALNGGNTTQGGVRVMTRGGSTLLTISLTNFFGGAGQPNSRGLHIATRAFDPRVFYDAATARWYLVAVADSSSATSSVLVAVSQGPDPTAGWNLYQVDVDPNNQRWADYPSVGFNRDWLVVQANMFANPNITPVPTFATNVFVFDKSRLLSGAGGGAHTKFTRTDIGSTQTPAVTLDAALPVIYLVNNWSSGAGVLQLFTISGPVGSETLTQGAQAAAGAGQGWTGGPAADFAPQLGTTRLVQSNDQRVQSVVYRHGSLWVAQTIFLPAGAAATRSAVQWWEINPATGAVLQRGRVDDPAGAAFYAFPSIAVNASRDVLLGYSRFSRGQHPSANYSFRAASDPPGMLRGDVVLKAGEGAYDKSFTSTRNRWGDYSATVVDPADDTSFWTLQEYAAPASGSGPNTGRWAVWWGRVSPFSAPAEPPVAVRAESPSAPLSESAGRVQVVVARAGGDSSAPCHVDYATSDGTAREREDYAAAFGSLSFAPGETQKTVTVFVTDDAHAEGAESFQLLLSNPRNCEVASAAAVVQIAASDAAGAPNPVRTVSFDNAFFVRQHYIDFFNREPDAPGLQFWTGELASCGADEACRELKRQNVSAAFFLSIEFQQTGYLVHRAYAAALGPRRVGNAAPLTLREFLPDTQAIGRGVVVNEGDWQARIESNRVAFFNEFVQRPAFTTRYPATMSAAAFVDALNANTTGSLSQAERDGLVNSLSAGTLTRAQVLRAAAEDTDFAARERNRAFVLMQYFGYLRRNPNDPPNTDFSGLDFWLGKLEQFGGNYEQAQMVKSFLVSEEYKLRFGP